MATTNNNFNKLSWSEVYKILCDNHDRHAVVVFKQNPTWKREYTEQERSYKISGSDNAFDNNKISTSLWGDCLGCEDYCRLDWYMKADNPEERWQVDYCYLLD